MPVQQVERVIIQERSKQEVLRVLAVDLEDHYLFLVLADNGGIDLIAGRKSYLGSIQLDGLSYHLGLAIHFDRRAMDDALALMLIDHVEIVRISHKIHIDVFIRHEGEGYPLNKLHIRIVDTNDAVRVIILENQEVTIEFTNDLKIGAADVLSLGFAVNDLLRRQQAGGKQHE